MDLLSILMKGGAFIWPIILASVLALGIAIDRFLALRKAKMNLPKFMISVRTALKRKDIDGAIAVSMGEQTPVAVVVRKGLKKYHLGHRRVRETIEQAGKQEIQKLERGLSTLATVSGVAPLMGFLGTVTGMIAAFMQIEQMKGAAAPSDLAGGIWEALLTTAFGLAVGIVALILYNYFVGSVQKVVSEMESVSNEVADAIEESETGRGGKEIEEEFEL
jgi:biopolymer transport protein ExbB